MQIAFLTNVYPSVSHTFIRREIEGLERSGHEVLRFSIRKHGKLVDPDDIAESHRTTVLLEIGAARFATLAAKGLLRGRPRLSAAVRSMWSLHRASDRGLLRHLAYLAEAIVLRSLLQESGIRHVHVHFGTNPAAVALLAHRLGGSTFSMTVHGPDEFDAAIGLSLGRKVSASKFSIGISSFGAAQLRRWVSLDHWSRIHVVHCSVDASWFNDSAPVPADSNLYLSVGRLSAQKGQALLLEAMALAVDRGFRGQLRLVGDGEMRETLVDLVTALGLEDRVSFAGSLDAAGIRVLLDRSRALVLPSFAEGLPVVLMEAMARRRPVITTSIMGIPELVRDGIEGILTTAGDVPGLADALLRMESMTQEQLSSMGNAGYRRVRERHDQSAEVGKLEVLLARAISGEPLAP